MSKMSNQNFIALRHKKIKTILKQFGLDFFIATAQPVINYCTDAIDIPGLVAVSRTKVYFITDNRFKVEIKQLPWGVYPIIADKQIFLFLAGLQFCNGKKIGLDFGSSTLKEAETLSQYLKPEGIQDIGPEIAQLLNHHDAESLKRTKKAIFIAKKAFMEGMSDLQPGITEIQVANNLIARMRLLGGGEAFPTIVAFGPNAAKPHAVPTQKKLKPGDLILVDMGSSFKGMHSDFTRTLIFRGSNSEISGNIALLKKVSRAAGKKLLPYHPVAEYDIQVRDELSLAGIEKYFTHALGHGIGFLVHATPRIAKNSKDVLTPGMIVTMEPGVYFEGKYGVRHEDMYLITQEKSIILTNF
jgi:Xaa-Pro aminopeptidase